MKNPNQTGQKKKTKLNMNSIGLHIYTLQNLQYLSVSLVGCLPTAKVLHN